MSQTSSMDGGSRRTIRLMLRLEKYREDKDEYMKSDDEEEAVPVEEVKKPRERGNGQDILRFSRYVQSGLCILIPYVQLTQDRIASLASEPSPALPWLFGVVRT